MERNIIYIQYYISDPWPPNGGSSGFEIPWPPIVGYGMEVVMKDFPKRAESPTYANPGLGWRLTPGT